MAVAFKGQQTVTLNQVIYGTDSFAEKLVEQIILLHADSLLEMLVAEQDHLEGELTRRSIMSYMQDVKCGAQDMIEDVVSDLARNLADALSRAVVKTAVTRMDLNADTGKVEDAQVGVAVEFVKS